MRFNLFSGAAIALVPAVLTVSALPFDDTFPRDLTAANDIITRGVPLWSEPLSSITGHSGHTPEPSTPEPSNIIKIECVEPEASARGVDMTHDVLSWVQYLVGTGSHSAYIKEKLGLTGDVHVQMAPNNVCHKHIGARYDVQYVLTQTHHPEGMCHSPGCSGKFTVAGQLTDPASRGVLFTGNLYD